MARDAKELLQKYKQGTCTPEEQAIVEQYFNAKVRDSTEFPTLQQLAESEKNLDIIFPKKRPSSKSPTRILLYRIAAASIVILLGISVYFYNSFRQNTAHKQEIVNDALPGGNRATLVLADGRTIDIDGESGGLLAEQAGVTISKTETGEIVYNLAEQDADQPIAYNSIITPNGGTYKVILPDGSAVQLNAASSLRYPTRFTGKQREVELDGEAFFEIKANPQLPFVVKSKEQLVKVLGTVFNINAYGNEPLVATTLSEGKVEVTNLNNRASQTLLPGQQSQVKGNTLHVGQVDIEQAMAWKDNVFIFRYVSLKEIMRQLCRWYDVEIDESTVPDQTYYAVIPRTVKLSSVLAALEAAGELKFKIQERRVMVERL